MGIRFSGAPADKYCLEYRDWLGVVTILFRYRMLTLHVRQSLLELLGK